MENTRNQCRVCGGQGKPSSALNNTLVSFDDFGGDAGKRGTTQSRVGKAQLISCIKCEDCGHSWVPTSIRQEALYWWGSHSSLQKTQICDTNTEIIGAVRRWETLTGSEIERLYQNTLTEVQKDGQTYLNKREFKPEMFKRYINKFSVSDKLKALNIIKADLNI